MGYIKSDEKAIFKWLKSNLDEERLLHSIGTARCAADLATKFGLDDEKAYITGLLHDCAKCFKKEDIVKIAKDLNLDENEFSNFKVLHAPVSAYIAQKEFGIEDEDMLSSIRWHTLGKRCMSEFEKVIFLADKIEPMTRDLEFRDKILLFLNEENGLNKALFLCYKEIIKSLVKRDLKICPSTIDVYNGMLGEGKEGLGKF